ncbi:MAG: hypothetical protein M1824_000002 [Vezdaea acicularis]|nr:MAG: hypothetical protein M1824_000002 [Vezdaea acicularis]
MDIGFELRPKSGELRPQHNVTGGPATRENMAEVEINEYTHVNARLETVQYGLYDGKPAALIILKFIFKYRPGLSRIRGFHVDIEFSKLERADGTAASPSPQIVKIAPEECTGELYTEERSNTVRAGASFPLPSGALVHIDDETAKRFHRTYELKLSGWIKSSTLGSDTRAVWDCVEAKKKGKGVVPKYLGAVIVRHPEDEQFQATFKVDADQGSFDIASKLFEWTSVFGKKDTDDPVVFDPTQPVGKQYTGFADFKDLELESLIKFDPIAVLPIGYS